MKIEIYGKYYYRGENYVPRRITVVEKGPTAGFYWCIDGHYYKHEIFANKPERFLIHQNKIQQ